MLPLSAPEASTNPEEHHMSERQKQHHGRSEPESDDTEIRGRDFRGTSFAAGESEQTRERERVANGEMLDEAGEPTTAEIEERQQRGASDSDRTDR